MELSDLNELTLSNIGEWPAPAKALVILVLCAALGWAWYYFITRDQLGRLDQAKAQELTLRKTFEDKQDKAANLEAYEQQLTEMEESFGAMVRQLPDRTEVAGLLVDVSQTGLAAGLEFELFQPTGEQDKDFYAELPIRMRVNGRYHEFGRFISGLAALPRIVTIHDVRITAPGKRVEDASEGVRLTMEATVKTYRYLEEAGR
ncbi:MAG: type 4a pilus biogenesis protein PilO [Thiohalocapsa sp.]|uniref:type 4a pilus biogenesis protein PilO n=1 Tax=Thiohalocapsa sp. TaxID=2497641 RepID=UPI0025F03160|nr:type 4a pilus biogenesis protein PilO [Thiohalocapsa sp.]MCG6939995.1 type 4a pilus biogenesis protein PilO [Thiohalocapsa sp.]